MTITVRHASASGRVDEMWTYDPANARLEVLVRMGLVSAPLTIHACSKRNPTLGAHPIERIDGESWRVLPQRYVLAFPHRIAELTPIACPIGDVLASGQQLVLTCTPPTVDAELERLMMTVLERRGDAVEWGKPYGASAGPLTWRPVIAHPERPQAFRDGLAFVTCRIGHESMLSSAAHRVAADGSLVPSFRCPVQTCGFNEHVRLEGWSP